MASYAEHYRQWQVERFRVNPNARQVFVDSISPVSHYLGWISLYKLMRELHVGYRALLRILDDEGVTVVRVAVRDTHYCYVTPQIRNRRSGVQHIRLCHLATAV